MLTRSLLFRIAGPTLFVSLLFLVSCTTAAVYLSQRQSASVRDLDESIRSRGIAGDLLKALDDLVLVYLHREGWDRVEDLHGQIRGLLSQAREAADSLEEARIVDRLEAGFGRYLRTWQAQAASPGGPPGDAGRKPLVILEMEVRQAARELERYNSAAIERSQVAIHRTAAWMAWGLLGVGVVAAAAGRCSSASASPVGWGGPSCGPRN
jgi:two-component system sensor histidine kinase HydH